MGNVSGKRDEEDGPSGTSKIHIEEEGEEVEEEEEYMEYSHSHSGAQISVVPIERAKELMHIQGVVESIQENAATEAMPSAGDEIEIPTMIVWSYDGKQVAVEGSWDNWKSREFLYKSGRHFNIMKVLQPGVYHYRFNVDGEWRYAPDLPRERDDMGNIFHILDLQGYVPEVLNNAPNSDSPPSSPISSYDNSPFHSEEFTQKLPEFPPLLQKTPLDYSSSTSSKDGHESLQNPITAVLNHLYIRNGYNGTQSVLALSSTERFRSKYVTLVLYKPMEIIKKSSIT